MTKQREQYLSYKNGEVTTISTIYIVSKDDFV